MKGKILKSAIAVLLIVTLTMANFILLGINVVSYAAEAITINKSTSHKNVEFMAFWKDDTSEEVTSIEKAINVENLELFMRVSVKQEGYFNGSIEIKDSNFKFKTDILSEGITKIEENAIYLSQINAGETREIKVGIQLIKDDVFDLSLLDKESEISISGIYKDSTQKDKTVTATKALTLKMLSPYAEMEEAASVNMDLITNKIIQEQEGDKRIIQLKVEAGINDNLFPIKSSKMDIVAPQIEGKYPEQAIVVAMDKMVTNAEELTDENINYDKETGNLEVLLKNEENDNKVNWAKEGMDTFIVTYIFDTDKNIEQQNLQAVVEFSLYDSQNTVLKATYNTEILTDELDSIVNIVVENEEESIYKGKLYAGIEREIKQNIELQVYYNQVVDEITLQEDFSKMNLSNIYAKQSIFDKENLRNILGENGTVSIYYVNNGETEEIATIGQKSEADENGKIVVTYPENVKEVNMKITSPEKSGKISITNIKQIKSNTRSVVKNVTEMEYVVNGSYKDGDIQNEILAQSAKTELMETQTTATLELNKTELSTMSTNKNVEIRAVLHSKDEKNDLYKNPVVRITLPDKIEQIHVNSIHMLYEEELEITKATLEGNTIVIQLDGEQTKYKEEAIEGTTIIINADLTLNRKLGDSTEKVIMTYSNEKAIQYSEQKEIGEDIVEVSVVSYVGLVATNSILEYGLETVNNNGEKTAKLELGADEKNITVVNEIINNNETVVSDVAILGTFPIKDAVKDINNIQISVEEVKVEGINDAKVYYTENVDATTDLTNPDNKWVETITDNTNVKKYLVVLDKLEVQEQCKVSYSATIPENLEYNQTAQLGYNVTYANMTTLKNENVNIENLNLVTGEGPVLEAKLEALVGGKQVQTVSEGEIIKFVATVTNTGTETVKNAQIVAPIPEGTVYVEEFHNPSEMVENAEDISGYREDESKKQVEFTIEKIEPNEVITYYYEVKVNKGTETINNEINVIYEEVTKQSNEFTANVETSNILLTMTSRDEQQYIEAGHIYFYNLDIENLTDKELENIQIQISLPEHFSVVAVEYDDVELAQNEFVLEKLEANEKKQIYVFIEVDKESENEIEDLKLIATATESGNVVSSNEKVVPVYYPMIKMANSSPNAGGYVKSGDIIKYEIQLTNEGDREIEQVVLEDKISPKVELTDVLVDGNKLDSTQYSIEKNVQEGGSYLKIEDSLQAKQTKTYTIQVVVNKIVGNEEAIEISNIAKVYVNAMEYDSSEVMHILEPEEIDENDPNAPIDPNLPDDSNNSEDGEDSNNTADEQIVTKLISGTAWLDENENGQKDENETLLSGITVKLLDTKTSQIAKDSDGQEITAITNEKGFYSLTKVPQGNYIVIFEYDTDKYVLTTYEKEGVVEQKTSKAISKKFNVNGQVTVVGGTEIITIENSSLSNINIGLVLAKTFDLKLDKYITKVIVQNSKGTSTQNYEDTTFAKTEIDSKLINATNVIVEYKIKITNEGDAAGYARKIVDYMVSDYKFSSELNKDWYQSNGNLYNTSLANQKIEPGETKELTLILTKQMTDSNTGLVNNLAEIVESYNEEGLVDKDSIVNNKVNGEDDMGSADLILSIKTGQIVATIAIILISIIIIGTVVYFVAKYILKKAII